jgi:O-antigen ligase
LNLVGLILSYSRGAYISFLIGLIVLFALNMKKINYKKFALYSLIMISVISFICFGLMNTRTRYFIMDRMGIQKYDLNRFEAQITGISMTLDHITGYGPGQYEAAVNKALKVNFSAHSLYARVLLENGAPGFLLLMSVLFMLLVKLLSVKKYENDNSSIKSSILK